MRQKRRTSLGRLYRIIDTLTGSLICFSIIFAPWAFGTVHSWSILTLNAVGLALGVLLASRISIRLSSTTLRRGDRTLKSDRRDQAAISCVIVFILSFIAIHGLNARASFDAELLVFDFSPSSIQWLPASYDQQLTTEFFFKYLALALVFWSVYDWITDPIQNHLSARRKLNPASPQLHRIPLRVEKLLFLISINASILALVSILQKLDNSGKLLWLLEPQFTRDTSAMFGPFAYRGNASTFFNLIWPISLFLLVYKRAEYRHSQQATRAGGGSHLPLYPITAILLLAPLFTTSRAGLIVLLVTLAAAILSLRAFAIRKNSVVLAALLTALVGLILLISGSQSMSRLKITALEGFRAQKDSRVDIYQHLPGLIKDHIVWGSGPGTFSTIYLVHRKPAINVLGWKAMKEYSNDRLVGWSAWAHCDPIEFLITFGVSGTTLCICWLAAVQLIPWLRTRRRPAFQPPPSFTLLYIATWGFLLHSTIDFPFHVYSLIQLFVILSACILGISYQSKDESNAYKKDS